MNANPIMRNSPAKDIQTALRLSLLLFVLCGLVYPVVTTLLTQWLFPVQAEGSLIRENGKVVGSVLIGQPFVSERYFQGRPSAAGYDPMATTGSNLAPSNPALRARVEKDSINVQVREHTTAAAIPADLLAASGSGLDPDISPAAALLQIPRIARTRGMPEADVRALVQVHIEGPQWHLWGQPRVNVLKLNLALDRLHPSKPATEPSNHAGQP